MVPCSSGSADAGVDKESGTCWSGCLCLRTAAAQTARPATFIATIRCETVTEQVRHRLLLVSHPWPLKGKIITREPALRGALHFAGRKVQGTRSVRRDSTVWCSLSVSVLCGESAALGASLGVGPAPKVVCRSESATPPSSPLLLGTASPWLYMAAIPPHLCRDESRQKCSGQPGGSPLGCWHRQCQ